jgi:hypothetical protein
LGIKTNGGNMIKAILERLKNKKKSIPLNEEKKPELSITEQYLIKDNEYFNLLDKPLKNLLSLLKVQYDYDKASYYSYQQPFTQYDKKHQIFLKESLEIIYAENKVNEMFDSLPSFSFICLNRSFDNTYHTNIIVTYSFLTPDNTMRIILDGIDTDLGFLRIEAIDLKKISGRKLIEYKEYYDDNSNEQLSFQQLQSVFSTSIYLRKFPPLLDIDDYPLTEEEYRNYEYRDAELIIRQYFDKNSIKYCSIELLHKTNIIKSKLIDITHETIDIDKEVDDFLFPLLETVEALETFNLSPIFSKEFMANDFSDYILLKKMDDI